MRLGPFQLIALALAPLSAGAETLEEVSRYAWETEIAVGMSGLEISDDGKSLIAISDQGWWLRAMLERDGDAIVGLELNSIDPILGLDGNPAAARRTDDWSDAEGLALSDDGTMWVAFERWAHVNRFAGIDAKAGFIKDHETFREYADNWQFEAIAVDPGGDVYLIPEKPLTDGFPIYRLDGERWVIDGTLPERDLFSIVGADFDERAGDLYLLERKLVVGIWWQSRIRRVNLTTGEDVELWTSERGDYGNLEGISVWHAGDDLRLLTVSDNNGEKGVPTEFVEFRLTE